MTYPSKRFPRSLSLLVSLSLLGLGTLGCDKGKKSEGDGKAEAGEKEAGKAEAAEAAEAGEVQADTSVLEEPAKIDDQIMADLKAIVANCEVNPDGCTVNKCANKEEDVLRERFKKKDGKVEKDRGACIDTFAAAMADEDENLQTAAVSILYSEFKGMPDTKVPPAAAMRLIEAWSKLPQYQSNQSQPAVVHSAMLSGHPEVREALYKAIEAHPEANKSKGYRAMLTYGRLDALPKLQEVAKGDDEKITVGALSAWRNMYKPTDEEKAKVCPWLEEYLQDPREDVFEAVGLGLSKCGGEYVSKVIDEGEKRLAEKHEFGRKHYFVFRSLCHDFLEGEDTAGREEECKRNYAFLQKVVDDEEVDSENRARALDAIYYQRRTAETRELAQTYVNHKDEKVAETAKEIVEKLKDK